MKRKYIKPSIINYFLLADSALLADSGQPGTDHNIGAGGGKGEVSGEVETGNGGEALSKHYNAWEAWDEF